MSPMATRCGCDLCMAADRASCGCWGLMPPNCASPMGGRRVPNWRSKWTAVWSGSGRVVTTPMAACWRRWRGKGGTSGTGWSGMAMPGRSATAVGRLGVMPRWSARRGRRTPVCGGPRPSRRGVSASGTALVRYVTLALGRFRRQGAPLRHRPGRRDCGAGASRSIPCGGRRAGAAGRPATGRRRPAA